MCFDTVGDFAFVWIMDQTICIKFCYKNEIKYHKVSEMLSTAFGESAMSKTRVYEWYKRFWNGYEDTEDDECTGHPSTSITNENVKKVEEKIKKDRQIIIREVTDDDGISTGICHEIFLSVLGIKRVAAKFVPKVLNFKQKSGKWGICQWSEQRCRTIEMCNNRWWNMVLWL